jgi:hypothetical protein
LMKFVPNELQNENFPCRFIPLNEKDETIDSFYRCGTQLELEEALVCWLRNQIAQIEQPLVKPKGLLQEGIQRMLQNGCSALTPKGN